MGAWSIVLSHSAVLKTGLWGVGVRGVGEERWEDGGNRGGTEEQRSEDRGKEAKRKKRRARNR